ncbi:MAG TPA: aminopeptidase P N-terminal domain-containing protein [Burkholderiales bacterium]
MSDYSIYAQRRAKLIEQMQAGVAVIPTAAERVRNRDAHYPYRFDSYFYYLSGFTEPGAALVLMGGKKSRSILFCRDKDPEREVWDGYRCGPEGARERFGFDEGHSLTKLDELMPNLLADQPVLHYAMGTDEQWDARIVSWLNSVRSQSRSGVTAPTEIKDVRRILDEMRIIKGEHELALMRRAAQISTGAHCRAMRATRPGKKEFEIEAELIHEFRRHGAQAPAYMPIVAGGANACVLHYVENSATLKDGDLLLIDAGCELDGYASDITRTFPVNGRFKGPQKDVYQMVLAAQAAAIAAVKPDNAWDQPHDVALKVLAQGMIDLGLCKGSLDKVLESGEYKRFYMHRTGHWLGLDVHDVGDYKRDGKWRELKPGMVLTVEPGCYVRPAQDVPEKLWNIGMRIEDDVLVTAKGQEVLTSAAPKKIEDIEKLMQADAA